MNETYMTVVGRAVTEPRSVVVNDELPITSFRMVSTARRFDRHAGTWVDGDSIWLTVTCFRGLASNVARSVEKGDRVIAHGRLRVSQWTDDDGTRHNRVEIVADAVGHDLVFGTTRLTRVSRVEPVQVPGRAEADELVVELEAEEGLDLGDQDEEDQDQDDQEDGGQGRDDQGRDDQGRIDLDGATTAPAGL